ncbi:3-oxoacyl-[acyl-carrier-protein] reductase, chloroplastic [Sesamum alatum]|uniref:3-oxoacyl-[acyl-carrier-protein] reductase, chloroplastic n=1 Tax=Sesamum alatum TaxID=300844 RepID=A0AAE1XJ05_9LAMI|nr:3-oxoacyl-[acyl-carrier-protein] reductase, chloroplastic [Sesamum alatum]
MASEIPHTLEPWSHLNGKIVMVTGASSGLGREFCLDLAKAGCRIVAIARRMDRLRSLCDEINQLNTLMVGGNGDGCRAVVVELDIELGGNAVAASVAKAWDAFGYIDVLVNNAGVRGQVRSSLEITEEEWNKVLKTNLIGTWQVSKCVASRLQSAHRRGSIINISSITGLNRVQFFGGIAYNSSKSAIDSLTRIMALELGGYNIRVNAIAPGLFPSEISGAIFQHNMETLAKKIIPLRTGGPANPALTSLVRYLIHDSSSYVSGNIFIVDFGSSLPGFQFILPFDLFSFISM